jgi:hypothetical protein
MPRLLSASLSGSRRRSPFRKKRKKIVLHALLLWDQPGDDRRNGIDLLVHFFGADDGGVIDRGSEDNLDANVHRIYRGNGEDELRGEPLSFRLRYSSSGPLTFVRVSYDNRADGGRRFNEDPASRDEVFARVDVFDIGEAPPPLGAPGEMITNVLTGRY